MKVQDSQEQILNVIISKFATDQLVNYEKIKLNKMYDLQLFKFEQSPPLKGNNYSYKIVVDGIILYSPNSEDKIEIYGTNDIVNEFYVR